MIASLTRSIKYYLLTISPFFLVGLYYSLSYHKVILHKLINVYNSPWADIFFKYYTHVGDGLTAIILLPYLILKRSLKNIFLAALTLIIAGVGSQLLKHLVFFDMHRPWFYFASDRIHWVEDVRVGFYFSFPSGHTSTTFAFFSFLTYLFRKNKPLQVVFALLAVLSGFSRIYLSQHFLVDVIGGMFWGIFSFYLAYFILRNKDFSTWDQKFFSFLGTKKQ